jgi:hypothetical protein
MTYKVPIPAIKLGIVEAAHVFGDRSGSPLTARPALSHGAANNQKARTLPTRECVWRRFRASLSEINAALSCSGSSRLVWVARKFRRKRFLKAPVPFRRHSSISLSDSVHFSAILIFESAVLDCWKREKGMGDLDIPSLPPAVPYASFNGTIKVDLNDTYFCSSALGGWVRIYRRKNYFLFSKLIFVDFRASPSKIMMAGSFICVLSLCTLNLSSQSLNLTTCCNSDFYVVFLLFRSPSHTL